MIRRRTLLFCVFAFFIAFSAQAASVPAIDINPGTDIADPPGPGQYQGRDYGNSDRVQGWLFLVEQSVTLTHLGWFDQNGDGLSHEHRIGLWQPVNGIDYELIVETTLPGGSSSELAGPWRRASVSEIELSVGNYFIGGLDNSASDDALKYFVGSQPPPVDPRLDDLTTGAFRFDSMFGGPELTLAAPGLILGPMFFIEPVPEPSAIALFAIGAMLLVPVTRWGRPRVFQRR